MAPAYYKAVLLAFMQYNDNVQYEDDFVFTPEHLGEVQARDVVAWFNFRAYGKDLPSDDDRPTHARSNTLLYWKKALSYHFPNKNMQWNELRNEGNPTKSQALNDLIKKVKKFECRGQGSPSPTLCP